MREDQKSAMDFAIAYQSENELLRAQNRDLLAALELFTLNDLSDERVRYILLTQASAVVAQAKS